MVMAVDKRFPIYLFLRQRSHEKILKGKNMINFFWLNKKINKTNITQLKKNAREKRREKHF